MNKIKLTTLLLFFLLIKIQSYAQRDYLDLLENGFNFFACVNYEKNSWIPSESYNLNYKTKGFETVKFKAVLSHELKVIPDISFKWETNLNNAPHNDLIRAHIKNTPIEEAYNKFMFIAGFGKDYIDEDKFDFKNPRTKFQLAYLKDTYFLQASPNVSNLKYQSHTGELINFNKDDVLTQFVKFEEFRATFRSSYAIIPYVLQVLFTAGAGAAYDPFEVNGRFGLYYNNFNKPYSITQAVTSGSINGDKETIYDAKFKSFGIYEQYDWSGDSFYFNMGMNLGYSWLRLTQDQVFKDSNSPAFLYYATEMEMGWDIKLSDFMYINIAGFFNYGLMYGITSTKTSEKDDQPPFEVSSLINNDLRYKFNVGLYINI